MKYIRPVIPFLDDILVFLGLVSFIVASYLVNAVLGTYVLGIAFFVAAIFAGAFLQQFIPRPPQNKRPRIFHLIKRK